MLRRNLGKASPIKGIINAPRVEGSNDKAPCQILCLKLGVI